MAFYTYDEEADALYIMLVPDEDPPIAETIEVDHRVHVDLDSSGRVVGVEILYPGDGGFDPSPIKERFGIDVKLPFTFAA
jgi:uncharacterized protein YuzE